MMYLFLQYKFPIEQLLSYMYSTLFSFIFAGLKFRETFLSTFRKSLISRSRRKIVFAGNLISRNWRFIDFIIFFFYKNCMLTNNWNKTNMLSLSSSCIPLQVSLTVIKDLLVLPSHYRVSRVLLHVLSRRSQ